MNAIDLSKQQELDAHPIAIQQINFIGNLDEPGNTTMFFIIEEAKDRFRFFTRNSESIVNVVVRLSYCVFYNLFGFNIISIYNDSI